jgi:hypothetical protein
MNTSQKVAPSLEKVDGSHLQTLGLALQGGFWSQIKNQPGVFGMMQGKALTAEQGERLAKIATKVMASENPQGQPWEGWAEVTGTTKLDGLPPA